LSARRQSPRARQRQSRALPLASCASDEHPAVPPRDGNVERTLCPGPALGRDHHHVESARGCTGPVMILKRARNASVRAVRNVRFDSRDTPPRCVRGHSNLITKSAPLYSWADFRQSPQPGLFHLVPRRPACAAGRPVTLMAEFIQVLGVGRAPRTVPRS